MHDNNTLLNLDNKISNWVTIREAVDMINHLKGLKITTSDIYRNALFGNIHLSIYFQSPVILQKVRMSVCKLKLKLIPHSYINRICMLEKNCFFSGRNLILSTEGEYIHPSQRIIDTALIGYEYVLIQRLLARSLDIPQPITGAKEINYGITVNLSGKAFQVLEKMTWEERVKQQTMLFSKDCVKNNCEFIRLQKNCRLHRKGCFPIHTLPNDACFVIKNTELDKLIKTPFINKTPPPYSTRISTPLSRLFWLACKHNEEISPLIRQPYKLLSIFEQWASDDGITDRLSGDTLKTALERGSPSSSSPSK